MSLGTCPTCGAAVDGRREHCPPCASLDREFSTSGIRERMQTALATGDRAAVDELTHRLIVLLRFEKQPGAKP